MERSSSRRALLLGIGALGWMGAAPGRAGPAGDGPREAYGDRFRASPTRRQPLRVRLGRGRAADSVAEWHEVAMEATGIDHSPPAAGETRVFGEQLGPGRSSRAMAIVHVAMFDALNSIARRHRGYTGLPPAAAGASPDAAVAQAAHDTLAALYPSQAEAFAELLAQDLSAVRQTSARAAGVMAGQRAAAAILALRAGDGADHREPQVGADYPLETAPGRWRPDPIGRSPLALGGRWSTVRPFVLDSAAQLRVPPPPPLDSAEYAAAYDEAQQLGGDGVVTPTVRSEQQGRIGVFWAYDGVPSLCAPPRLYNQLATRIATLRRTGPLELARLYALANLAMAEAGLAIWESKYHYAFWRPVTGIRVAGGTRLVADPGYTPLGAPASNLAGPNFTPPFPAYPSGHAGFGAALFETLRQVYGTDRIAFSFMSDEFNGATEDNAGNVRPRMVRSFRSLSEAEEENGQSRIYLGIHWAFDKTAGIALGRQVARQVVARVLQPA